MSVAGSRYQWLINGVTYDEAWPFVVDLGQPFRVTMTNHSHALHPMHLHGHTRRLETGGSWQDTILVPPMGTVSAIATADNPGLWVTHCHNLQGFTSDQRDHSARVAGATPCWPGPAGRRSQGVGFC